MSKAKKAKNEEQRDEDNSKSEAVVKHQKLCLSIDMDRRLIYGLMPSHNGILTICCIQSLTQMSLKLSEFIPLDHVIELIKPYHESMTWQIQFAASRGLIELVFQCQGIDTVLKLFVEYLNEETSLRGQTKLGVCALC